MMPSPTVSSARPHRRQRRLIDRHFSGAGAPTGEREMRQHLVDCPQCRDHYERHLTLAAVDPQAALPAGERLARGLGLSARPAALPAKRRWLAFALSASAACAVAILAMGLRQGPADVQPRGGVSAPRGQLLAYEVTEAAGIRAAVSPLRADSALAFAYANMGHRQRLMIFAVDEARRIYWYHPAWENPGDNPVAVEIKRDDAFHELTQAVRHRFSGHRLQLFGVFLDRAMSVQEVERLVARAPDGPRQQIQIDIPGAEVATLDLQLVSGP